MEGGNCSGSRSGGVVKNRSSSGCLIIKKKLDGVGGVGSSTGRQKLHESKKEKRRPWLTGSDSVSSDEELREFYRRRGISGPNRVSNAPLVYKRGVGNHGEFRSRMNDFDDVGFGMRGAGINRNKLDVYDFDEYDDLSDVERIGMGQFFAGEVGGSESRFLSPGPGMDSSSPLESESGISKGDIIYRRRNSFNGRTIREKIKGSNHPSIKRRFEVKKELPISLRTDKLHGSDEAIRLQGKSGVLKVMVKHKKDNTAQLKPRSFVQVERKNTVPRSQEKTSKSIVMSPSPYSESKLQKEPKLLGRVDKNQQGKRKSMSSDEESDEESEDSDRSPKMQSHNVEVRRPVKRGRYGGMQMPERSQPNKLKEGKVKRGSGTEKQLLREKIRNMLVSAGWTIDYRPRRGRDYSDAVYVNPAGTAYWSIIKAYDAFQKQLEEGGTNLRSGDDSSSLAPISEDILSKLTRQTRKKIKKELKRKNKEQARSKRKTKPTQGNFEDNESDTNSSKSDKRDEKLSSFIRRSGKNLKGGSKVYCRDGNIRSTKMHERAENSSCVPNSKSIHGRKSKKIGRCTLLVRNSETGLDFNNDGFVPYTGKRNLLSLLIDSGTVKLSEKVHYMNRRRTRVLLEGWITRDGIHCACCSKILTISKFEIHAAGKVRQPFQNIYVSSGVSLLQCQIDAWNRQVETERNGFHEVDVDGDDPNDDTCAICGDGGNLICCDSCPSTFHQTCLDIRLLPPGDWHCPHCSCKFCCLAEVNLTEENDTRMDTLVTCLLCEGKYHASCMEEMVDTPANASNPAPFCGKKCQELFEGLQKLLGIKHELEGGLCWSLIHRTDLNSDTSGLKYPQRVEWNSKLAVSLTVMEECFLPIIDRRSGFNMIHNVLYNCGSNFTRLNYSGFYTAILEKGDEIVSAASIRIRGNQLAEMPFIGTRHIYRHQGMCRRLFTAIEVALRSLKVEKLIIPAISELMDTWTRVFGFSILGDRDKLYMKTLNMLAFPGTDMLQKKLLEEDSMKRDLAGVDSFEAGHSPRVVPDVPNKSDLDTSLEPCSAATGLLNNDMMNDKSVTNLCSQEAVASVEETSLHNSSGNVSDEINPFVIPSEGNSLVSTEGTKGTISSSLQLDTQINESAIEVKLHASPDASAHIHEIGKSVDDSPAKHVQEGPMNPKLTEEASEAEVVGLPPAGTPGVGSSDALLNGFLVNDGHTLSGGTWCSKNGSVDKEHHFLSEASGADVVVERTSTSSPAEGNVQDVMEIEADRAHEALARATYVCSSSQTTEFLMMSADGMYRPSHNGSCGSARDEEPRPDSFSGDGIQQSLEREMHYAHDISSIQSVSCFSEFPGLNIRTDLVEKHQDDSCDAGSKGILEIEVHHVHENSIEVGTAQLVGNISSEASVEDVGTVRVEKSQFDSCAGGSIQVISEGKVLEYDDGVEVTSIQP